MGQRRATVIAALDTPGESERLAAWLQRWQPQMRHCSETTGCGCRNDSYDVEAPEALAGLPPQMRAASDWAGR